MYIYLLSIIFTTFQNYKIQFEHAEIRVTLKKKTRSQHRIFTLIIIKTTKLIHI